MPDTAITMTPDEHRAVAKVDGRPRVSPSQISAEKAGDLMLGALDSLAMIEDREIIVNHKVTGTVWLTLWRNATPEGDLYSVIEGGIGGLPIHAGLYFTDREEALAVYAGHIQALAEARAAERAESD